MSSLRAWLQSIGLDKYAKTFEQHDLDLDVLAELNDDEFKELGVSLGDRKRLHKSLRDHDAPNSSTATADAPQTEPGKAFHAERGTRK